MVSPMFHTASTLGQAASTASRATRLAWISETRRTFIPLLRPPVGGATGLGRMRNNAGGDLSGRALPSALPVGGGPRGAKRPGAATPVPVDGRRIRSRCGEGLAVRPHPQRQPTGAADEVPMGMQYTDPFGASA